MAGVTNERYSTAANRTNEIYEIRQRYLMIGILMSLAEYAEEFCRPVAEVKVNGVGKIIKPPKPRLLSRICSRVETFFIEWTQHSYEAWVKNGRPDNF